MSNSLVFERGKRLLAMASVVALAGVAPALAANGSGSGSCRTGDAPLRGGASTSTTSAAGLVARGWDSASSCRR
jgi:hypothetical protein